MKGMLFFLIFACITTTHYGQKPLAIKDSIPLEADHFWGIDSFDALYSSKKNIFYKKWNDKTWQYGDFSLGKLSSVSILNPLKILLFYELSNTVVFLDKYLTEIDRINFNTISEFKNAHRISAANDNSIWIFDANTQQLDLFDTDNRKTLLSTPPQETLPLIQRSNFNVNWIVLPKKIVQFNIYGSLLSSIENPGYSDLQVINDNVILKKQNMLFYYETESKKLEKINLPEIPIKQFYVTNEILYIYDHSQVYCFTIKSQKK